MGEVVEYFESLLAQHGDSPKSLDWSAESQATRFRVLREVAKSQKFSVMDVGCGLGHFAEYLDRNESCEVEYTGIDASEKMIHAALRSGRGHGRFFIRDAFEKEIPNADFVVSSGMLNVKPLEAPIDYTPMIFLISRCFEASKIGCAINMLSSETVQKRKRKDRIYYPASSAVHWASQYTKKFSLRHDYLDNDFTLYMYK